MSKTGTIRGGVPAIFAAGIAMVLALACACAAGLALSPQVAHAADKDATLTLVVKHEEKGVNRNISGAEFTALLYLPSLRLCGSTEALRQRLLRSNAELFPFLKNGSAADLYILSHTPSHTCDEQLSAEAFGALLMRIVEEESAAERIIFSSSSKIMTDKAWRAYGALLYARDLTALDMLSLCSSVRIALACHDGKDAKLPPVSTVLLNTILARGLDCSVITETGICRSRDECCSRRAELVSNLLRSFGKAE
jgi:protein-arginine kinase